MIKYEIRCSDWLTFPLIIVNLNHFFIQPAPALLSLCFNCYSDFFSVNVNESRESELEHSVNVRFRYCETRIDYMGTCILMGNVSSFRIAMSDDWKTNLTNCPSSGK